MILVAGGTGRLGTQVVQRLTARRLEVRVLTRDPARARHLDSDLVKVMRGDVREKGDTERATVGVGTVVSAIQGFAGVGGVSPRTVDGLGNSNLIREAKTNGVEHFVLVSVQGAAPDHPMELFRVKFAAEAELRQSGLAWTIIRPTAFMEFWAALIGAPLVNTGRTRIFGRGRNPINFVSVADAARMVEQAVVDPSVRGETIEIGGPENLTLLQVAEIFERVTGKTGKKSHVPLPMMRLMSIAMKPVNPTMARQIQAGVVMDTADMTWDLARNRQYRPEELVTLAEVVRRDYGLGQAGG
ncbi:MAG TPA: SDR family oxidoreductase [Candidatus Dormibacteraeota bacterium]|nr:SDR family oxidoreductase [Candidatus Dormibacteraeota bacterium]